MTENQPREIIEQERRPTVAEIIALGNRAVAGACSGDLSEYTEVKTKPYGQAETGTGEFEAEDGVILDLNVDEYSESEKEELQRWIEAQLGNRIEDAPIAYTMISPDEETRATIFAKQFGTPKNPWFLSQWQNEGEKPSYILWAKSMYEEQEEVGFTRIEQK